MSATRSAAMASSNLRRWPTKATPSSLRSSPVRAGEQLRLYRVIAKRLLVLLQAEVAQPARDVHSGARRLSGGAGETSSAPRCAPRWEKMRLTNWRRPLTPTLSPRAGRGRDPRRGRGRGSKRRDFGYFLGRAGVKEFTVGWISTSRRSRPSWSLICKLRRRVSRPSNGEITGRLSLLPSSNATWLT